MFCFLLMMAKVRLHYACETTGGQHLRPWMLAWRADAGCSGFMEPDQLVTICELICFEGCFGGIWKAEQVIFKF